MKETGCPGGEEVLPEHVIKFRDSMLQVSAPFGLPAMHGR